MLLYAERNQYLSNVLAAHLVMVGLASLCLVLFLKGHYVLDVIVIMVFTVFNDASNVFKILLYPSSDYLKSLHIHIPS